MATRRLTRRRRGLVVFAVGLLGAGVAVAVFSGRESSTPVLAQRFPPSALVKVARRDLVVTEKLTGTLGFADERKISASKGGTVTSTAAAGTTVAFGKSLFAINREPVVLLRGSLPAYRSLTADSGDGPDIKQLEQNLADLGFGVGLTIDESFTSATGAAIKNWEKSLGRATANTSITQGEIVFAPTPLRVSLVTAGTGSAVQAASPIIATTAATPIVTMQVESSRASDLKVGQKVALTLPAAKLSPGTITAIGSQLQTPSAAAGSGNTPTVAVTVSVDKPQQAAGFTAGSVEVEVEKSRDKQVLVLPVTALLALAEGGYAVQLVDPTAAAGFTLVPVKVGTVTDEEAAVTGSIKPGSTVVVPS
jgi:hypothetical protein